MSAETELFSVLDAGVGLAALVADRIYPHALPEASVLPAVVYSQEGCQKNVGLDISDHGTATAFSISGIAQTHSAATTVAAAIESALIAEGVPADNRYAGFDEQTGNFVAIIEVTWWG